MSAFQLSSKADVSERGDHRGPQILAKLVLSLPDVLSLPRMHCSISLTLFPPDPTPDPFCCSNSNYPGLGVSSDRNITQTSISGKRKLVVCVIGKSRGGFQAWLDAGIHAVIRALACATIF